MTISHHRGAICHGFVSLLRGVGFASVSVVVEVGKEDDEGDSVANQSPLHPLRERTACVEGLGSVTDCHMELDLLNKKCMHKVMKAEKRQTLRRINKCYCGLITNF